MTLHEKSGTQMFVQYIFPIAMLWALLAFAPVIMGSISPRAIPPTSADGAWAGFLAEA